MLPDVLAERVAGRMRRYGYPDCTAAQVETVWVTGTLNDHEALASAILQEFDGLGLRPMERQS